MVATVESPSIDSFASDSPSVLHLRILVARLILLPSVQPTTRRTCNGLDAYCDDRHSVAAERYPCTWYWRRSRPEAKTLIISVLGRENWTSRSREASLLHSIGRKSSPLQRRRLATPFPNSRAKYREDCNEEIEQTRAGRCNRQHEANVTTLSGRNPEYTKCPVAVGIGHVA